MMAADLSLPEPPHRAAAARASTRTRDLALMGGLLVLFLAGLVGLAVATGWQGDTVPPSRPQAEAATRPRPPN